jgi:hypothetical protein
MSEKIIDKLSFERQGENGMNVEIIGSSDTLRSMFHAALMNHKDLRNLMMPVILMLINDDEFKALCVKDMVADVGKSLGLTDEDDDVESITTD